MESGKAFKFMNGWIVKHKEIDEVKDAIWVNRETALKELYVYGWAVKAVMAYCMNYEGAAHHEPVVVFARDDPLARTEDERALQLDGMRRQHGPADAQHLGRGRLGGQRGRRLCVVGKGLDGGVRGLVCGKHTP